MQSFGVYCKFAFVSEVGIMKFHGCGILVRIISVLMMSGLALVVPAQFHHHSDDGDICLCGLFHLSSHDSDDSSAHNHASCNHHHSSESAKTCSYIVLDKADTAPDNIFAPAPVDDNLMAILPLSSPLEISIALGNRLQQTPSYIRSLGKFAKEDSLRAPPFM